MIIFNDFIYEQNESYGRDIFSAIVYSSIDIQYKLDIRIYRAWIQTYCFSQINISCWQNHNDPKIGFYCTKRIIREISDSNKIEWNNLRRLFHDYFINDRDQNIESMKEIGDAFLYKICKLKAFI